MLHRFENPYNNILIILELLVTLRQLSTTTNNRSITQDFLEMAKHVIYSQPHDLLSGDKE